MGQINIDGIKKIYGLLGDDLSKEIFEKRLMYSLTGDMKFIRNVVCTIPKGREIYEKLKEHKKEIGIFGAGDVGRHLVAVYQDIEFACFIDNKRAGTVYEGLPVISLKEFKKKHADGIIIISTKLYHKEIKSQLLEEGFSEEEIINIGMEYAKLNHLQYELIPKGLWSETKELKLKMSGTGSVISQDGELVIQVSSIDECIDKPVTYIKMDIEGAEYQALLGARKTIAERKPKLAICTYHKPEDMWEIPGLLLEINPKYQFFLRHYSFADNETVLYAL